MGFVEERATFPCQLPAVILVDKCMRLRHSGQMLERSSNIRTRPNARVDAVAQEHGHLPGYVEEVDNEVQRHHSRK